MIVYNLSLDVVNIDIICRRSSGGTAANYAQNSV